MGGVKSRALRPFKSYNFQNRAQKYVEKQHDTPAPKAAPRHASSREILEKHATAHPEIMEDVKSKHDDLVSRMNKLSIERSGLPTQQMITSTKKLPERRTKVGEPELAFEQPEKIPEGKASITQLHTIINEHYAKSAEFTAKHIATEYKLDTAVVEQVLKHFQPLQLKFNLTDQFKKDHKKVTKQLKSQGYVSDTPEESIQGIDIKKLTTGKA